MNLRIRFSAEQQYDDEGYEAGDEDLPDGIPEGYDLGANYIGHIAMSVLPVVELESHRGSDGSIDFAAYFKALETPSANAESGERHVRVYMNLYLPLSVFSILMAMKGTRIKLTTAHDSLVNPKVGEDDELFEHKFSSELWGLIRKLIKNLAALPLWVNHSLSATVFGGKQNYEFWKVLFDTGTTQAGQPVLAKPLNLDELIT